MPIFFNKTKNYFLITSFKVMYSTLLDQSELQEIFLTNYLDCIRFKGQKSQRLTVMFVRNPYSKLISFFEDKFVRHPNFPAETRIKYSDRHGWQNCQLIFFPYFNIDINSASEIIAQQLKNISFAQFISCLPSVCQQDPHLTPQTNNIKFQISINRSAIDYKSHVNLNKLVDINLKVDRIFKMENLDRDRIQQELGLNLTIIKNKTPYKKVWDEYFDSPKLLEIVNNLYQSDFQQFNYPYLR